MANTSIAILLLVSLVAIGGFAAINVQSITGNFQIYQRAPIEGLAAYFMYDSQPCDEILHDWDARGRPIPDKPAELCLQ